METLPSYLNNQRFTGLHIASGSLSMDHTISIKAFKSRPCWTLTDHIDNWLFFDAWLMYLANLGIKATLLKTTESQCRLRVRGWAACDKLMSLLHKQPLTLAKQNQYDCYCQASMIYQQKGFRSSKDSMEDFIRISGAMNPDPDAKKQYTTNDRLNQLFNTAIYEKAH